jgi:NAD(P)-dependent dehydrogenase (short-subunit alcohol dehydrogenase family)
VSNRFENRTIVVTGAGSGIGHATATRIAAEGGRVVAVDLDPVRLEKLDAAVRVTGDVTDPDLARRVVEAAGERIDGLACVAGIMDGFLPPSEVDDDTWDRVLAVNLTAAMRLTRAVLPSMIAAGAGSIVTVASEAVLRPSTAGAAYTASKAALVAYTRNVAFFHGPQGVRANAVVPGPTITGIEGSMRSEYAVGRVRPVMAATMPRPVGPEHAASAISWLLSDEAANVNGIVLPSDGGWSAS